MEEQADAAAGAGAILLQHHAPIQAVFQIAPLSCRGRAAGPRAQLPCPPAQRPLGRCLWAGDTCYL